ncbi:MAG: HypC/HybG/HupF family hydrogenase formation chaperone [Austwickia sp.]|jgi:hydrogenase expression/formation protein HypC|nr:MAG: HypC/HybG/HupF family hydrogenase formation chaperone [Austwickia sp.]
MCLGIPGQVVDLVDEQQHLATVDVSGVRRTVSVRLLADARDAREGRDEPGAPGVAIGDWVLVHVGFALAKVDEQEAAETLAALRRLDERYAEELAAFSGSIAP